MEMFILGLIGAVLALLPSPPPAITVPEPTPRPPVVRLGDAEFECAIDCVFVLDGEERQSAGFFTLVRKITAVEVHHGKVTRLEGSSKKGDD